MDSAHPARFLVAAALLADAIIGHMMFRAGFQQNGVEPILAATVGALIVVGMAVMVVVSPGKLILQLARGVAGGMIIGLALAGLLFFVAVNFENGGSGNDQGTVVLWGVLLLIAQVVILFGCGFVEGTTIVESIGATAAGTFKFWMVAVVVVMVTTMFG